MLLLVFLWIWGDSVIIYHLTPLWIQGLVLLTNMWDKYVNCSLHSFLAKCCLRNKSKCMTRGAIAYLQLLSKQDTKRNIVLWLSPLNFCSVSFLFYFTQLNVIWPSNVCSHYIELSCQQEFHFQIFGEPFHLGVMDGNCPGFAKVVFIEG